MTFVSELEPRALFARFDEILAIPRPSKKEEGMRRYVIGRAEARGLSWSSDRAGNIVVRKPASPGREGAPGVVLQGHLDMVAEKNAGTRHDFERDPIVPRREDGWIKASGTTLGADNGLGVAAMLAVMAADDLVHGPLELLFTVDEETGLTGVVALDPAALPLAGRLLLNLDSEEEGTVTIGCAGAGFAYPALPVAGEPVPPDHVALEARISGLLGGHSGMDIHLGRGNAVQVLARALAAAAERQPFRLAAFAGGDKHNALAREATAVAVVPAAGRRAFAEALEAEVAAIAGEIRAADPGLRLDLAEAAVPERAWAEPATRTAVALLNLLPHGVLAMSRDIPGLVETSANLAAAAPRDGSLALLLSIRSSVASALRDVLRRIRTACELAGAGFDERIAYPAWKPDLASPLLARFKEVHRRVAGTDPEPIAIHAGLECGVLGEKYPGLDRISIGPVIQGAHSPDERAEIASVGRFYRLLTELLEDLSTGARQHTRSSSARGRHAAGSERDMIWSGSTRASHQKGTPRCCSR